MSVDSWSRESEYWQHAPIWAGRPTVFLLGGGDSLRGFDIERLRGRRILAVNSSVRMAARIAGPEDVLYFSDTGWFDGHQAEIEAWPGLVFSVSRRAKGRMPDRVHRPQMFECSAFDVPGKLRHGLSSGHIAVSLAIAGGAGRCVLLGYDMRLIGGRSHHHDDYGRTTEQDVLDGFLKGFAGWHRDALDVGVDVVNASPGSALAEFPLVDLADEMERTP